MGGLSGWYRLHSRSHSTQRLLQEVGGQSSTLLAEPNYIVKAVDLPDDIRFPELWGLRNTGQAYGFAAGTAGADISAAQAWEISTGSSAIVVGIVDTGIDYSHPDLAANIWAAPTAFTVTVGGVTISCPAGSHGFNAILNSCDPMDDFFHGTHVAGTIAASGNNGLGVVGVNWTGSLMGAKFLDSTGSGTAADAINAIEFLIQAKAAFASTQGANVRVLSNSWGGGGFSQALLEEISRAAASDMLFVAAAGNNGANNDLTPFYPAAYNTANLLAVAATDNNDQRASFRITGASRSTSALRGSMFSRRPWPGPTATRAARPWRPRMLPVPLPWCFPSVSSTPPE
jgi:serine protease